MSNQVTLDSKMSYNNNCGVQGCGVFFYDFDPNSDDAGGFYAAIPFSMNSVNKFGGMNNSLDFIVVFPGFKVILYDAYDYGAGTNYTVDNTLGNSVVAICPKLANTIASIKVFYLNIEIALNGCSNNTAPST